MNGETKAMVGGVLSGVGLFAFFVLLMWGISILAESSYNTYRLVYVQNGKYITKVIHGYPTEWGDRIFVQKNELSRSTIVCTDCQIKQFEEIEE